MSQLPMEMYYIVMNLPRWLLCERVVRTVNGYLLYVYDPENDVYRDGGYAPDLENLRFKISARYGWRDLLLVRSFEEVVRLFKSLRPRIVHIARGDIFCVRSSDYLFSVKWDYDVEGRFFIKKIDWQLGGKEPETIGEALERLREYAQKYDKWIVLREAIKEANAYEVYPFP